MSEATATLAERIVAEASRWVDAPYVEGGNHRRGCDCVGLVCGVCDQVTGQAADDPPRTAQDAAQHDWRAAARATSAISRRYRHLVLRKPTVKALEPGDILLVRTGLTGGHTGIYLGNGVLIHARRHAGVVVQPLAMAGGEVLRAYRLLD